MRLLITSAKMTLPIKRMIKKEPDWKKIFANCIMVQDLSLQYIKKSQNSILRKQVRPQKEIKDFNRHFTKKDICILSQHSKRCSSLVVIRMQIGSTLRFYYTPTRKGKVKKTDRNK